MATYNVAIADLVNDVQVVKVGFGDPATNQEIVVDAANGFRAIADQLHGKVVAINGAASLIAAIAIAHEVAHVTKAVAAFDPKLQGYVVAVSHDPKYKVGQLITL